MLHNAVVAWNIIRIGRLVEQLRAEGHTIDDATLALTTPLMHKHLNPFGRYQFDLARMRQTVTNTRLTEVFGRLCLLPGPGMNVRRLVAFVTPEKESEATLVQNSRHRRLRLPVQPSARPCLVLKLVDDDVAVDVS